MGLITLILFPLPTIFGLSYLENIPLHIIFDLSHFQSVPIVYGLELGIVYGFMALLFMRAPVFEEMPVRMEKIVESMHLNTWDALFLSICAGVGEELLFRSGVQFYLGPIITSILFVGIHGYLNPWNWRMSLYGIIVLPFIFLISYGFESFGLWFAVSAHTAYDFVLFLSMRNPKRKANRLFSND